MGAAQEHPSAGVLLKTKLFRPVPRPQLVPRPRLVERLDQALAVPLTLISASAGSGKTTLLADWAARARCPVAWISLDEGDNDPIRFLQYLIAGLQGIRAGLGETPQALLRSPQPPPVEYVLTLLINDIIELPGDFVLVLDDYHTLKAQAVHTIVTYLLDHLPPSMHLLIAGRTDPPLPLSRLRGRLQLVEVREADLRFSGEETGVYLSRVMGLALSQENQAALHARTEGWIVGLQLAALALRGRPDPSGFIADFSGSYDYILDYLTEDVLAREPEAVRSFLLRTSILERLSASLCDAVIGHHPEGVGNHPAGTGQSDSQDMLENLQRSNLFTVPQDDQRRWYRYHHLFAELLRAQLGRLLPEEAPLLHRRAALWYEENGYTREAVAHALQAGDADHAAELIERAGQWLVTQGQQATLLGWLQMLPEALIAARPWLCIWYAWVMLLTSRFENIELRLQEAERAMGPAESSPETEDMLAHVETIRGFIAVVRARTTGTTPDLASITEAAHRALALVGRKDLQLRSVIDFTLAMTQLLAGDAQKAASSFVEAAVTAHTSGNVSMAVGALYEAGAQHVILGRLRRARELYLEALQWATPAAALPAPLATSPYAGLSNLYYEWNDLDAAEAYARDGLKLSLQLEGAGARARNAAALGHALWAQGRLAAAEEAIREAEQVATTYGLDGDTMGAIRACRARLWLSSVGADATTGARWAAEWNLSLNGDLQGLREVDYLVLAAVLIGSAERGPDAGALGQAQALLARLRRAAVEGGRHGRLIAILVLQALAGHVGRDRETALAALAEALRLAGPEGYVRTFLDAGRPMLELLNLARARGISPSYVGSLLAAPASPDAGAAPGAVSPTPARAASMPQTSPLDDLSQRELEVLRLMAAGLSNDEIAQALVIAVSTVKAHVNHIFAKLGVRTRTQAIARARSLGLM